MVTTLSENSINVGGGDQVMRDAGNWRSNASMDDNQRTSTVVKNGIATIAAKEFNADNDWQTLPRRLKRLVDVLENWVRFEKAILS